MSVEVTHLPAGLVVVTDVMPHLQTAALGVWVGSGSRNEQPDEHGISHLLEHMAFKGTSRRTAPQIAEEVDAAGGQPNTPKSLPQPCSSPPRPTAEGPLTLHAVVSLLHPPHTLL